MLAQCHEQGPVGSALLAQRAQVPPSYLAKILQNLAKAGIVISRRGASGGFILARTPEEVTILDVVQSVDPIHRITKCPLNLDSHCEVLCPMHANLDAAIAEVQGILGSSTIAELLGDKSRPSPMVETIRFLKDSR